MKWNKLFFVLKNQFYMLQTTEFVLRDESFTFEFLEFSSKPKSHLLLIHSND